MAEHSAQSPDASGRLLQPPRNCWRIETAQRFAFIVDADDYFVAVRAAMLKARSRIFLIGWDFDARIRLGTGEDGGPVLLGDFVLWLARRTPTLEIRLLRWDTGAFRTLFRGNTLWTVLRWKAHPRITLRLDGAHPLASSHHQKIVVIDDCLAFCGGIDITGGRWDRREHADDEPDRRHPDGTPYDPWHDVTSAFDGDAAQALGELARDRWHAATGEWLDSAQADSHASRDCWPGPLLPTLENVRLGIARTRPRMDPVEPIHEIEEVYLDMIARARHVIYAESQYFASRRIGRALAARLKEADGPEIVIINPVSAEGWLEPLAMDSARARLVEALQRLDVHGRLRLYHPRTEGGLPIYVHAKVVIVDDQWLRLGSSNFNNRSMRLDSECDVVLAADEPGEGAGAEVGAALDGSGAVDLRQAITAIRNDLLAEHLGVAPGKVAQALEATGGSLIAAIEALRGEGRTLVPYVLPELSGVEQWLADNEILDPNGPDQIFEPPGKRGLFKGWHLPWRRRKR